MPKWDYPVEKWDVIYSTPAGFSIERAAEAVLQKAKFDNKTISFMFNETVLNVSPQDLVGEIVSAYWEKRGSYANTY